MYIADEEKDGRKAALKKLVDLMGKGAGEKMGSMKKPMVTEVEVESKPLDDFEGADEDFDDVPSEEPNDDEKEMIAKLYHKYC